MLSLLRNRRDVRTISLKRYARESAIDRSLSYAAVHTSHFHILFGCYTTSVTGAGPLSNFRLAGVDKRLRGFSWLD